MPSSLNAKRRDPARVVARSAFTALEMRNTLPERNITQRIRVVKHLDEVGDDGDEEVIPCDGLQPKSLQLL